MGTWGPGNLDSDGALDAMATRSSQLIERVWSALRSKTSTEADEYAYDELFLDLEWLLALDAGGVLHLWDLPPVDELDEVTARWLDAWADYFDGLAGPEFKAERRAVIEDTFGRLRALCVKAQAQRDG